MSATLEYIVKADGWVAGKWCAGGSIVSLTETQAKYENVALKKDDDLNVEPPSPLDEPTTKPPAQAEKAPTEVGKRSRTKK